MSSRRITFSRRKLLVGGAAAVALPALGLSNVSPANTASAFDPSSLNASDRKVSMLTSADSSFADKIGSLYPGLISDPHFQMLSPLAVLITLENGPAVRAFTTCWSVTTPNGTYETALFRYAAPGSKRHEKEGITIASAQADILRPGESRLLTPFFTLSPKNYQKLGSDWYHLVKRTEPGGFLASALTTATATKVWLDAVVFQDRKAIGPDKHHLIARLRARRNAQHDEARAVISLLNSGATDADLIAMLDAHSSVERPSGPKVKRWYLSARKQHAQFMGEMLKLMDRQTFASVVLRVSKLQKTQLHKLST